MEAMRPAGGSRYEPYALTVVCDPDVTNPAVSLCFASRAERRHFIVRRDELLESLSFSPPSPERPES